MTSSTVLPRLIVGLVIVGAVIWLALIDASPDEIVFTSGGSEANDPAHKVSFLR